MEKKANVFNKNGEKLKQINLPNVFNTDIRVEIIKRAVLSEESKAYQPKGAYKRAGLETSARYIGVKDAYATLKNKGQSRLPREFFGGGRPGRVRYIPSAVSGRRAHPPKPEKKLEETMNKKEWELALKSAIAATTDKEMVLERGHKVNIEVPIVLDTTTESIIKSKEIYTLLNKLIGDDLQRAQVKRGKNKKNPKTALLVVSKMDANLLKAARNIPGLDVVPVEALTVKALAPGAQAGRLTIYTESAIEALSLRWKA